MQHHNYLAATAARSMGFDLDEVILAEITPAPVPEWVGVMQITTLEAISSLNGVQLAELNASVGEEPTDEEVMGIIAHITSC